MFASVLPQLSARLRRALAYAKAFAFLEDPPRRALAPDIAPALAPPLAELAAACAGDRRRGPAVTGAPRPGSPIQRCCTARATTGRSGRPAAPAQRCATPTTSGKRTAAPRASSDRRASVPGGFLHR
jgi:hypothetical protein